MQHISERLHKLLEASRLFRFLLGMLLVCGFALVASLFVAQVQRAAACHKLDHEIIGCVLTELPPDPTNTEPPPPPPTDTPVPLPTDTPVPPPTDTPIPPTDTPVPPPTNTTVPPPPSTPVIPTATNVPPPTLSPTETPDPFFPPTLDTDPDVTPVFPPTFQPVTSTPSPTSTGTPSATATETDDCGVQLPTVTVTPTTSADETGVTIGQHRIGCADPGDSVTYTHTVENSSPSPQLVNITAFSALAWDVALYSDNGSTPLTDSDGDGRPDVGPLAPNESIEIVVAVSVPTYALSGTHDVLSVMVSGGQSEQGPQNWVQIRTAAGNGQDE